MHVVVGGGKVLNENMLKMLGVLGVKTPAMLVRSADWKGLKSPPPRLLNEGAFEVLNKLVKAGAGDGVPKAIVGWIAPENAAAVAEPDANTESFWPCVDGNWNSDFAGMMPPTTPLPA